MTYQEREKDKLIDITPDKNVRDIEDPENLGYPIIIKHKWEYRCEDLFGVATITSKKRLDGDTLDQIVIDIIMAKQLKKGHTENHEIEFEAEFKEQWEEIKENEEEDKSIPSSPKSQAVLETYNLFNNKTMKSRKTASILAILLGIWGVHKFYLGKKGQGFLYLLFTWTLIPSLLALIDFIVLITMTDEEFNKKYNK